MNCFAPLPKKFKRDLLPERVFETIREEWNLIPKAKKITDADGVAQDIIEYEPVKVRDIPIAEFIHSFSDDIGIQNILQKVAMTGDKSYLNQTGRTPLNKDGGLEPVQDFSNVPMSKTDAFNAVAEGVRAYDALPAEVKEKMSFAQFAEGFGQEQFNAYIQKIIEANKPQEEGENK